MKKQKYGNKKVIVEGEVFDSKREYDRWVYLKQLQDAHMISELERQVRFLLIPAQYEPDTVGVRGAVYKGKCIERECVYIADFAYRDEYGRYVVEDVKSKITKTPAYKIKRKLMYKEFGIRVREVE